MWATQEKYKMGCYDYGIPFKGGIRMFLDKSEMYKQILWNMLQYSHPPNKLMLV